ncbi:MAG: bifunctional phosphoribosylaminoimidazolecarboxamide formyltransferase/IMP cyclohydrolase [Streptosporangiaceae bacterium]
MGLVPIRRALISVYDKTGLEELAAALHAAGVEITSTGSTAARISAAGVPVTGVEQLTGFPECLDGRVKTLHPRVHAGLLADMTNPRHEAQLAELGIEPFQLVVSNLYPFTETVASGASPEQCVEQIDIGGPSMVRAAAKNHGSVAVIIDPSRYADVLAALAEGGFTLDQRRRLAAEAFAHTAAYDVAVASWFASVYAPDESAAGWPEVTGALWRRAEVLRYGENPHQRAALYISAERPAGDSAANGIASAELLHGKPMSYNNYVDADAARRAAYDFGEPCVAIIKHSNPCGIAIGADLADAHAKANACDPVSAFGGVIAANGPVTAALARQIAEVFTEVVIAPGFDAEALDILSASKNVRLLCCPGGTTPPDPPGLGGTVPPGPPAPPSGGKLRSGPAGPAGPPSGGKLRSGPAGPAGPPSGGNLLAAVEWRPVSGGILLQSADRVREPGDDPMNWELKAGPAASPAMLADLRFAWKACRSVKSNAILLAAGGASVGVGMGQVNRVDSSRLAVLRAGERAAGSVAASDAYFPFADGFEILAQAGVAAVVEPGGSMRDQLTITAAEAAGIPLYFTGVRHFYH